MGTLTPYSDSRAQQEEKELLLLPGKSSVNESLHDSVDGKQFYFSCLLALDIVMKYSLWANDDSVTHISL